MAKARMLHNKISKSLQVDRLPLQAQLLFTWMIPCADDEGRMKGEPKYIKGTVVPYKKWSEKLIKEYLTQMRDAGLIYYWEQNNEWFIEFIKWEDYQHIRKDRFEPSKLPSYKSLNDNRASTNKQPDDNQSTPQYSIVKLNKIEVSKSEVGEHIEDNSIKQDGRELEPPTADYNPTNKTEYTAWELLKRLEPRNYRALPLYLSFVKKIPQQKLYEWASEVEQSPNVNDKAKLFNYRAQQYIEENNLK